MQSNQLPPLMPLPFATNGAKNVIPEASQISVTKGAASLTDGFPPLTMTSPLQGGIPPFGADMNGVLFLFAQTIRWVQAGGSFTYDAAFATDPNVGGYPKGAVLLNAALSGFWINTVENNVTNPDATDGSAQGWLSMNPDWNATGGAGQILNRPDLAKVATSGQYEDLQGLPDLAAVATSGSYTDLINTPTIPPEYALPPATTTTLGGIIAGPGTTIAADGTLTANGLVKSVNTNGPDAKGNVSVFVKNAKGNSPQYVGLVAFQGGTGDPLICMMQAAGIGTATSWNGEAVEVDLLPASNAALGGVKAGAGVAVAADGTLSAALPFLHLTMGTNDATINNTSWLQYDFSRNAQNLTTFNGATFSANADGTLSLPDGHYLITGSLGMSTTAFDTYGIPAQVTVAFGQRVSWPGRSPDAVYANPAVPNSSQQLWPGGTAAVVTFAGILPNVKAGQPVWLAYTFEGGKNMNVPLYPTGDVYLTKIG